jgi:hypothetical protein
MNEPAPPELPKTPEPGSSQTPSAEEGVKAKDFIVFFLVMAFYAAVGGLCLFGVIQLLPPVIGFYVDAKNAILQGFASGNYAYALGRLVGTLLSSGLFVILLLLFWRFLGIVSRVILR